MGQDPQVQTRELYCGFVNTESTNSATCFLHTHTFDTLDAILGLPFWWPVLETLPRDPKYECSYFPAKEGWYRKRHTFISESPQTLQTAYLSLSRRITVPSHEARPSIHLSLPRTFPVVFVVVSVTKHGLKRICCNTVDSFGRRGTAITRRVHRLHRHQRKLDNTWRTRRVWGQRCLDKVRSPRGGQEQTSSINH